MQCLCLKRELEVVNDNDEDGMLFLATATSKKRKVVNHRWKKGRKGRREGREEGRQTDLNKQVMVQK